MIIVMDVLWWGPQDAAAAAALRRVAFTWGDRPSSARPQLEEALAALAEGSAMQADLARRFNVSRSRFRGLQYDSRNKDMG